MFCCVEHHCKLLVFFGKPTKIPNNLVWRCFKEVIGFPLRNAADGTDSGVKEGVEITRGLVQDPRHNSDKMRALVVVGGVVAFPAFYPLGTFTGFMCVTFDATILKTAVRCRMIIRWQFFHCRICLFMIRSKQTKVHLPS